MRCSASFSIAVETTLLSTASVPDSIEATLTFNGVSQGTVTYTNTGLTAGMPLRFALAADGTGLSTGMYGWSMDIVTKYGGTSHTHTFTDSKQSSIVRQASLATARLDGLTGSTRVVPALSVKGNGDVLWFASNGRRRLHRRCGG